MTKKPTVRDLINGNEITMGVLMKSVDRYHTALGRIEARLQADSVGHTVLPEQFNQLAVAVNKIAAYAAAMDETKKTMIKLTSKRIRRLDAHLNKLRVRMKRLEG